MKIVLIKKKQKKKTRKKQIATYSRQASCRSTDRYRFKNKRISEVLILIVKDLANT